MLLMCWVQMSDLDKPIPILIGRFLSPFVRRVAVTLNYLNIAFERQVLSAVDDVTAIERSNPIGRVPALILPNGATVIDSAAILDYLDEQVGADRALIPSTGEQRRHALYLLALICGTIERAMVANAERRRPPEKQIEDRLQRLLRQTRQGFIALDKELANKDWFIDQCMLQPDITTAVGFSFVRHIFPQLIADNEMPQLQNLTARCETLAAFKSSAID